MNTEESELKEFVIRDKALSITGEPAPWAELDPTSSWSNKAAILTPGSFSRLVSEDVLSINAWFVTIETKVYGINNVQQKICKNNSK